MSDRINPVIRTPIRFELVRSTADPAPARVVPPSPMSLESKPIPRHRRRSRSGWMPALLISLLVHAALLGAAVFIVVFHASKREVVTTEPDAHVLTLDLRTASTLPSNTQQQVLDPLPESRAESSIPAPPEVDLVPLPPLELEPDPEPLVEETQTLLSSFSNSVPPPASAISNARLNLRAPNVAKGSPNGVEGGVGPATAAKSAGGSAEGQPGGVGTTSTGNGPPLISSGLLHAKHVERPRYPDASRQRGDQGVVTCRLTIGRDGEVIDVVVEVSSGFSLLDDEAVRALKHWRFQSLEDVTDSPRVQALQRLEFKLGHG